MTEEAIVKPVIEIKNLTKSYGTKKALDNISFSVKRGEIMGFLGPNGAGKSTTMNIICGYLAPSSGEILINGINTADNPLETKKNMGYLPEIPPLYTDMTVLEYLDFVFCLKGVKANRNAHLRKIMEKVRIFDVKDRLIKNLSKGYKQRVGLAQALVGDPDLLILDEPTVGLDPRQIMEIREVIQELGKERTVILSTHIMQEVTAVCDSYTIINHGKIVATGSMDEFSGGESSSCRIRVKASLDTALPIANQIVGAKEVRSAGAIERGTCDLIITAENGFDIRENIFNTFSENKCPILSSYLLSDSLEELFLQAISEDTKATDSQEEKEEAKTDESNL